MKSIWVLMSVLSIYSQKIFEQAQSPRNANYNMNVVLDSEKKTVTGTIKLNWRNITSNATSELQFHLYLNAFSSKKSTHVIESGVGLVSGYSEFDYGYTSIKKFIIGDRDLSEQLYFIQPDDGNINDSTVVKLDLDQPVLPGDSLIINIEFISKLPKLVRRTGFIDRKSGPKQFYLIAQWFPKIGVLEESGWNCHQFHANTEFFSDYGVYDVKMNVPKQFIVGASGLERERIDNGETITYRYYAEDIHDFMWTAYPDFQVHNSEYKGVQIRMLYNSEQNQTDIDAQIQSLANGLDFYQKKFGPYPYPNITFLNAPKGAEAANGMEYPTIFTGGYNPFLPTGVLFKSEMVTIHEFGHQIFYGVIGTNEFESSWMDEGLNQFGELGTEDKFYGGVVVLPDLVITSAEFNRIPFIIQPNSESILTPSYQQSANNYSINTYMKPAVLLKTLEQHLGDEVFYNGMKYYYQKWKFKHPKPDDFFKALSVGTNQDLKWFFDQFFRENKLIDYEVKQIQSKEISKSNFRPKESAQLIDKFDSKNPFFLNVIEIENLHNGWFPIELIATLEDGRILDQLKWDIKQKSVKIEFYSISKIESAQLDPQRRVYMDLSFTNNGISMKTDNATGKFVNRWVFWIQNIIQLVNGL